MARNIKNRIKDFVYGMGSVVDLFATRRRYTEIKGMTYEEITGRTDAEAIAYDWDMVGRDFPIGK